MSGGFAPVSAGVSLAVAAIAVILGIAFVGAAWWMIALYALSGLVLGSLLGAAAHYNANVGIALLGVCVTVLGALVAAWSKGRI